MDHAVLHAFFLTLLAGLSTGIGSCIAFLTHHTNKKFLSVSLGFSAGVMIYPKSRLWTTIQPFITVFYYRLQTAL